MVEVQYSEQASDLMEQFSLSTLIQDRRETIESFSGKERELFKDVFPVMEELRLLFQPYKEKMETYYLTGYGITLLQSCYLEMVDKGLMPKSVEAVHAYCLQLDAEAIREQLKDLLNTGPEHMAKSGDFWDYLEASSIKSETKWYFSQFYRKPLEAMKELIELSRELIPLYQPYLEKVLPNVELMRHPFHWRIPLQSLLVCLILIGILKKINLLGFMLSVHGWCSFYLTSVKQNRKRVIILSFLVALINYLKAEQNWIWIRLPQFSRYLVTAHAIMLW